MEIEQLYAMLKRAMDANGGRLRIKPGCTCASCARIALLREVARLRPDFEQAMPAVAEDARAT